MVQVEKARLDGDIPDFTGMGTQARLAQHGPSAVGIDDLGGRESPGRAGHAQEGGIAPDQLLPGVAPLRGDRLIAIENDPRILGHEQNGIHTLLEQGTVLGFAFKHGLFGQTTLYSGQGQGKRQQGQKQQPQPRQQRIELILPQDGDQKPLLGIRMEGIGLILQGGKSGMQLQTVPGQTAAFLGQSPGDQLVETGDTAAIGGKGGPGLAAVTPPWTERAGMIHDAGNIGNLAGRLLEEGIDTGQMNVRFPGQRAHCAQIAPDHIARIWAAGE